MEYVKAGFVTVYLILVLLYLRQPRPDQKHGRVWNKAAIAVLYFLYAAAAIFAARRLDAPALLAVLAALCFCMVGDILIQYRFVPGAVMFFLGNLLFLGYQLLSLRGLGLSIRDVWWFLPAAAIPLAAVAVLERRRWLKLERLTGLAILYLSSVTFSGMLAFAIAVSTGHPGRLLLGAGLSLYMISDYFLIYREFRRPLRAAQIGNTLTYFVGMMLTALSVMKL